MAYAIEEIRDRRTRRGRIEYYIKWQGYGDDENTWETRLDLIKDGHRVAIKSFESERKKAPGYISSGSGTSSRGRKRSSSRAPSTPRRSRSKSAPESPESARSRTPSRARTPSRGRTPSRSKTPSHRRKASVTKSEREDEGAIRSLKSVSKSPVRTPKRAAKSTPRRSTRKPRTSSRKKTLPETDDDDVDEEDDEDEDDDDDEEKQAKAENVVSEYLHKSFFTEGYMMRVVGFAVLLVAVLADALIPEIQKGHFFKQANKLQVALAMLKSTKFVPSVSCLLMTLQQPDTRIFAKAIAIALVWRTAGEVLLQIPSAEAIYINAALGSFGLADCALLIATSDLIMGSHPVGDVLTQALCAVGTLGVLASDGIYLFFTDSVLAVARFPVMALSLVLVTTSKILQTTA